MLEKNKKCHSLRPPKKINTCAHSFYELNRIINQKFVLLLQKRALETTTITTKGISLKEKINESSPSSKKNQQNKWLVLT